MKAISLSKKGTKSETNEDASLVIANKNIFVVADGVGGGPSGDFASRALVDHIYNACSDIDPVTESTLLLAIQAANREIVSAAQDSERIGMASTVACAAVFNNQLITMHVGDSRIYRMHDGYMQQLTDDHIKQVQKPDGSIKQVVSNALGVRPKIKVDVKHYDWSDDDVLLLFSDGITDVLEDDEIYSVLENKNKMVSEKLNQLISICEEMGGRDDKTVIYAFNPS